MEAVKPEPQKSKRVRTSKGPYKFDTKVAKEVIKSLKIGCWMEVAAMSAGVSKKTVYNWLARGRSGESEVLAKFFQDYRTARHMAARLHMQFLFGAASNGNVGVSQWFLERRYPEQFSKPQKLEMTGKNGGPVEVKTNSMTSDEKRREVEALVATAAARLAAAAAAAVVPSGSSGEG